MDLLRSVWDAISLESGCLKVLLQLDGKLCLILKTAVIPVIERIQFVAGRMLVGKRAGLPGIVDCTAVSTKDPPASRTKIAVGWEVQARG